MNFAGALQGAVILHLENKQRELTTLIEGDANKTLNTAILIGRAAEIEALRFFIKDFFVEYNKTAAQRMAHYINFNAMVQQLGNDLPDDFPVRLTVLTSLETKVPVAGVSLTMADLKKHAAIQRMYEADLEK